MDRREFLRAGGTLMAGATCAYGLPLIAVGTSSSTAPQSSPQGKLWGMVIDLNKCRPGCTDCLVACRKENNVALHGDPRWDVHLIRKVRARREHPAETPEKEVLLLCNHCDHPPCVQACPVKATFRRDDGIVVVDQHRCIGCRYCMIACPYNARSFNYKENDQWPNQERARSTHGVPESCTFCAHLVDKGGRPACVEACPAGAIVFGDLKDPQSEVSKSIAENAVHGLREDLGTKPKVYYIGL